MYIYIACKERLFSFFLDELQPRFCQRSLTCWRRWRGTPSPSCCTDVLSCDALCLFPRPSHYSSTCSPVLMLVHRFCLLHLPLCSWKKKKQTITLPSNQPGFRRTTFSSTSTLLVTKLVLALSCTRLPLVSGLSEKNTHIMCVCFF